MSRPFPPERRRSRTTAAQFFRLSGFFAGGTIFVFWCICMDFKKEVNLNLVSARQTRRRTVVVLSRFPLENVVTLRHAFITPRCKAPLALFE